jgi:two-component system cell cycle response regulator
MPGDKERVIGAGFDGYVSKPIDPHTFVHMAEAYSSRS